MHHPAGTIYPSSLNKKNDLVTAGLLIQKENGNTYDRFRERIMFPIRDMRGRYIGFGGRVIDDSLPKYLNSPETPIFHKGKELYGLFEARQVKRNIDSLLIVEGYMDVIALAQHNIHNAVATLGTAVTTQHLQQLCRISNTLVFCFDGDNAGKQAAWRALETTLPILKEGMDIRFMFLPEKHDPDSYVRAMGDQHFQQQALNALPLGEFLFKKLKNETNINSIDGAAKLVAMANPLINTIPKGVFQHMMRDKLSQITHIDIHQLKQFDRPADPSLYAIDYPKRGIDKHLPPSTVKLLLALLIQHPELIHHTPDKTSLEKINAVGLSLLIKIIDLLKENPALTTGVLLEYWRDDAHQDAITKLATWEHCVPADGLITEFQDGFKRLFELMNNQQLETLIDKANSAALSDDEKRELQRLLKEKATRMKETNL